MHLRSQEALRIKPSPHPPIKGRGLFAERHFKPNQLVATYTGDLIPGGGDDHNQSDYVLKLSRRVAIDAARTNAAPGRLVNDPRGTGLRPNCRFSVNHHNKTARLIAIRPVRKGDEFLVSYGSAYWNCPRHGGGAPEGGGDVAAMAHSQTKDNSDNSQQSERVRERKQHSENSVKSSGTDLTRVIHSASKSLGDPMTYKQILSRPDKAHWLASRDAEHDSHKKMGTYIAMDAADVPKGARILGFREVFKLKVNSDGTPVQYKNRFTIQGFAQRPGIDYHETSAAVLRARSLRTLCAVVASQDLEFKQLDVETAYLHATLKEELYARAPSGLSDVKPGQVLKLQKTIYGLKQAGYEWFKELSTAISTLGYSQCLHSDKCVWVKKSHSGNMMYIGTYVDDIPYAYHANDAKEMDSDIRSLGQRFKLKVMGDAEYIIGWRIRRDRQRMTLTLDQESYVNQVLEDYGMDQCWSTHTPGTSIQELYPVGDEVKPDEHRKSRGEHGCIDSKVSTESYASVVGSLQYAACSTRPDIAHAVNSLAAFLKGPQPRHVNAAKRVLRYLAGTRGLGLTYSGTHDFKMECYADSDWAANPEDRKSISGYLAHACGAAIDWHSKRQPTVAQSSAEAEYVSGAFAGTEIVWMRRFLESIGFKQDDPTVLHMDNQSTIAMINGAGNEEKRKHIGVKYHYVKQLVEQDIINVKWISSGDNIADIFTKPLSIQLFKGLRDKMMGIQLTT